MTEPRAVNPAADNPRRPRAMTFRKRSTAPLPTPEQSRRQADVLRSAWGHFGEPGPLLGALQGRLPALVPASPSTQSP